jgi:hypothetical protein
VRASAARHRQLTMSQPEFFMSFWLWLARLWPLVPPLAFLLLLRGKLTRPFSFLVFGSLICLGVQWLVAQVALLRPPTSDEDVFVFEQMLDVVFAAVVQMILLSLALSLPLLWWLYRALRAKPAAILAPQQRTRKATGARGRPRKPIEPAPEPKRTRLE